MITKEAFHDIVTTYTKQLSVFLLRLGVTSQADREDILQNTFLTAWKYIYSYNPRFSLKAWLYRITRQQMLLYLKKNRTFLVFTDIDPMTIEHLQSDIALDESYNTKMLRDVCTTGIATLKEEQRTALILRYEEDLEYREISDIMKKPLGTVSTLIKRGSANLKQYIQTHYPSHSDL